MPDPELSQCANNVLRILRSANAPLSLTSIQSEAVDQCSDDDVIAALQELESYGDLVIATNGPSWSAFPSPFGQ